MNRSMELIGTGMASELIRTALEMRKRSYCPYSNYSVGAALLAEDGSVHTGCNVENAAYPAAICAERTAFVKAVSEGCRRFTAIAVTGGIGPEPEDYSWPCGECRQFMREFCEPDRFVVITAKSETDYRCYTLEELLPESFGPGNLVGGERYGL